MKTAITLALATILACGCGVLPQKEPPPKPFIATKWVVKLELPIEGEQPWFRFGDGRMEGYGGCNKVVANFVQDAIGSRFIAIRRMDRGTRACEPGNQAAEQRVLEVLQAVSSYTITVDEMIMNGSSGLLKFKSDPPAEVPK